MGNSSSKQKNQETTTTSDSNAESKQAETENEEFFAWTKDDTITQRLDFEKWYPIVADHTMKSQIIDCNEQEISAILKGYESNRYNEDSNDIYSKLKEETQKTLKDLSNKIDNFINENNYQKNGIFIRFSNRSPKDAVLKLNRETFEKNVESNALKIYKDTIDQNENKWSKNQCIINSIMRSLVLQTSYDLCIYNGNEGIKLIVKSDRLYTDFKMGQLMKGEKEYNTKLIIRKFYNNIDFECEFRVFIFKNELTAISQYNHFSCLNKIINNKQLIIDKINAFWKNQIHPNMTKQGNISSYVMDIAFLHNTRADNENENDKKEDSKENENKNEEKQDELGDIILIEINPFVTRAGALLFDWKKDVKLLTNQEEKNEVSIRFTQTPYDKKPGKLSDHLDTLYEKLYQQMNAL